MYQQRSILKLTIIAVSLSILLHVAFVVFSFFKTVGGWEHYRSQEFVQKVVPVEFMDEEMLPEDVKQLNEPKQSEKVTNIDFNADDKREQSDKRYDSRTEEQIQEQVEKELREFEAQEFAKYKKDKVDVMSDKTKTTNDGLNTEKTTENQNTTKSFAGSVTAEWFLTQRNKEKLLKPSYVCKGGGIVKVNIVVNREGRVIAAEINKRESNYKEACIGENALSYAKRCTFTISTITPEEQEGWIMYTFIAQ